MRTGSPQAKRYSAKRRMQRAFGTARYICGSCVRKTANCRFCCKDAPSTRSLFPIGTIRQARVIFRQAVITESRQFASFSRSLACTRKRKTLCTAARAAWCMTASFAASCFTTVRSRRCSTFGSTQMKALLTSTPPRQTVFYG